MSTSVIEPGTRLAGRYRLEERISDSGGSSLWKAIDEILARAVAVRTFDPEFPRIGEVVTSARAASRLTDPRLTQVFDADDSGESAYVVSEWVAGETLEQMLAKAPLEPGRAATLLYEAAEAITVSSLPGWVRKLADLPGCTSSSWMRALADWVAPGSVVAGVPIAPPGVVPLLGTTGVVGLPPLHPARVARDSAAAVRAV